MNSKNMNPKQAAAFAHSYLAELQDLTLAAQIRVLRESRTWSQADLAARAKMAQSRISLLESADYTGRTLSTLRKLAEAFDVGLEVSFAPYYKTVHRLETGSAEKLEVQSRTVEAHKVSTYKSVLQLVSTLPQAQVQSVTAKSPLSSPQVQTFALTG
jgi:transcriptional regulator with XRE-family HTH domain